MSELNEPARMNLRNNPTVLTLLMFLGLSVLLTLIPTIYNLFPRPLGRILLFLLMLAGTVAIAVFLLRHLYRRIHGEAPKRGSLKFTITVMLLSFVAVVLISTVTTLLLFYVFQVPFTDVRAWNAETIVGVVLNALLFPPLFCAPVAALKTKRRDNGFWKTYGGLVKRRGWLLFLTALVCMALGSAVEIYLAEVAAVIVSALIAALLLTCSFEAAARAL